MQAANNCLRPRAQAATTASPPALARYVRVPRSRHAGTKTNAALTTPTLSPSLLATLQRAAQTKSVAPEAVEQALTTLEAAIAINDARDPEALATIPGRWRLVFSTSSNIKAWKYIPVKEDFVVDVSTKYVALESEVGPFSFHVRGTIFSWDAATGALEFQFDQGVAVLLNGNQVAEFKPSTKPKTYTFFYADPLIATARSSAGPLSLLRRLR